MRVLSLALLASALAACASAPAPACATGEQPMVKESLYFGMARPGGTVTAADWAAFLESTVTPRFPQGLTWWPASGQWRTDKGEVLREGSYVLQIVRTPGERGDKDISALVAAYQSKFQQESVLRVKTAACVSF